MNIKKLIVIIALISIAGIVYAGPKPAPVPPTTCKNCPTKKVTVEVGGKKVQGTVTQLGGNAGGSNNTWKVTIPGKPPLYVKNTSAGSKGALKKAAGCVLETHCNGSCKNVTVAAPPAAVKKPGTPAASGAPANYTPPSVTPPTNGGGGSSSTGGGNSGSGSSGSDSNTSTRQLIDRDGDGVAEWGVYGPITLEASISPEVVNKAEEKCTIRYDVTNATECKMTSGNIFNVTLFDGNDGSKRGGSKDVSPATYTIECINDDGAPHRKTLACKISGEVRER